MDLQRETQKLLASVRELPSTARQTSRRSNAGDTLGSTGKQRPLGGKTKRRKRGKEIETSTTLELAQSPIKPKKVLDLGRETVEVLDTMSNPASARAEEEDEEKADAGLFEPPAEEVAARNLDFSKEEERVREVRVRARNGEPESATPTNLFLTSLFLLRRRRRCSGTGHFHPGVQWRAPGA